MSHLSIESLLFDWLEEDMKRRRPIVVAGLFAIAVLTGIWYLATASRREPGGYKSAANVTPPTDQSVTQAVQIHESLPAVAPIPSVDPQLGYASMYGELPRSMRGLPVPGRLAADEEGRLVLSAGVLDVFEFFIGGIGEESRDTVLGRTREYIGHKLPPEAAQEAEKILQDYVDYKDFLGESFLVEVRKRQPSAMGPAEQLSMLKETLELQKDARRRFMSPEVVSAFFGEDEAYDDYSVGLIELQLDPEMDAAEKAARREALEGLLPERFRERLSRDRAMEKSLMEGLPGARN